MSKPAPRQQLIRELLKTHPDAPKQTLAKLLVERHPLEFKTVDAARNAIRYATGSSGSKSRSQKVDAGKAAEIDIRPPSTLRIPRGDRQGKPPKIFTDEGLWFLSSDWHVPYHDEHALEAAVRKAVDSSCQHLYINGDAIDFYQCSHWIRDPRKRSVYEELQLLWEILDEIVPHFPGRKVYKIGNHEDRLTRRVWTSTPELAVLPRFDVDAVLEIKERYGFEVVQSTQRAALGALNIFHGHELAKGLTTPVSIARGVWNRARCTATVGHHHRTSSYIDTTGIKSKTTTCYSLGCLCDLEPDYHPVNAWNHGFALVELFGRRKYHYHSYIIENREVFHA